jgi:hypothetical protein
MWVWPEAEGQGVFRQLSVIHGVLPSQLPQFVHFAS